MGGLQHDRTTWLSAPDCQPSAALRGPRHARYHEPHREHVAEGQAGSQGALRDRPPVAADIPAGIHVAPLLPRDPIQPLRRAPHTSLPTSLTILLPILPD